MRRKLHDFSSSYLIPLGDWSIIFLSCRVGRFSSRSFFCWSVLPTSLPSQPGLRPSQHRLRPSQPCLRPCQPCLRPSQLRLRHSQPARPGPSRPARPQVKSPHTLRLYPRARCPVPLQKNKEKTPCKQMMSRARKPLSI